MGEGDSTKIISLKEVTPKTSNKAVRNVCGEMLLTREQHNSREF